MFYRIVLFLGIVLSLTNCATKTTFNNKPNPSLVNGYTNKGFALVFDENLYKQKIISKNMSERDLVIYQKNLKRNTQVKITNILNNKTIIAKVGKDSKYPSFNNSVLSIRIADEIDLDISQPYVEILEIVENSVFMFKKAKTYDEEKNVANKAPVNNISINDLNIVKKKNKKLLSPIFSYSIKIADFYFNDTALMMVSRIELKSGVKDIKIKKISSKKYRVYLGPFDNINSLPQSFNDISILDFENIEIIRND